MAEKVLSLFFHFEIAENILVLEDDDIPDLEKVDIEPGPEVEVSKSSDPEMKAPAKDAKNDYMLNLEASIRSQSAPPKGYRNIEIELDSDSEDEEIDLTTGSNQTLKIDDLPGNPVT